MQRLKFGLSIVAGKLVYHESDIGGPYLHSAILVLDTRAFKARVSAPSFLLEANDPAIRKRDQLGVVRVRNGGDDKL